MASKWQESEIDVLKKLIEKGYGAEEISKVLINRTPLSIEAYCYKFKILIGAKRNCIDQELFKKLMRGA